MEVIFSSCLESVGLWDFAKAHLDIDSLSWCLGTPVLACPCVSFPSCRVDILVSLHCDEIPKAMSSERQGFILFALGLWWDLDSSGRDIYIAGQDVPRKKRSGSQSPLPGQASNLRLSSKECDPMYQTASGWPAQAGPWCGDDNHGA